MQYILNMRGNYDLSYVFVTTIIHKAQFVRVGPFPMISGVIVKSKEKLPLDPDYKPAPLPFLPLKSAVHSNGRRGKIHIYTHMHIYAHKHTHTQK